MIIPLSIDRKSFFDTNYRKVDFNSSFYRLLIILKIYIFYLTNKINKLNVHYKINAQKRHTFQPHKENSIIKHTLRKWLWTCAKKVFFFSFSKRSVLISWQFSIFFFWQTSRSFGIFNRNIIIGSGSKKECELKK